MRIDRLLEITLYLLKHPKTTAGELARAFAVSKRTIYRDIEALSLSGVPISSEPGADGGYGLAEGYTFDRNYFTQRELSSLSSLFADIGSTLSDPVIEGGISKIEGLGLKAGTEVRKQGLPPLVVSFSPWGGRIPGHELIPLVRSAIETHRRLRFSYRTIMGEMTERSIDPLTCVLGASIWYVYGYCHLRSSYRIFRLSRMTSLVVESARFRPEDHVNAPGPFDSEWEQTLSEAIRFRVAAGAEARVAEVLPYEVPDADGIVTLEFPHDDWIFRQLLSLGTSIEVLSPDSMVERMRSEICRLSGLYCKDG